MQTRKLANIEVSAIGLGCMGFSQGYGAIPSESESIRLIQKAMIWAAHSLIPQKCMDPLRMKS
ncbi:hypothetical protein [uncultured Helicobacter sp.]|uniref:hypothetical protein n=1 Tax=uncultured Helicobacter sp. TaxID=175537 RepID=UPI00374FB21B